MEILTDLQRSLLDYRRNLYRPTPQQTVVDWAEACLKLTQQIGRASCRERVYSGV